MPNAFICYFVGEWEVENTGPYSDGLTKVLLNLIDNMPNGKTRVTGKATNSCLNIFFLNCPITQTHTHIPSINHSLIDLSCLLLYRWY